MSNYIKKEKKSSEKQIVSSSCISNNMLKSKSIEKSFKYNQKYNEYNIFWDFNDGDLFLKQDELGLKIKRKEYSQIFANDYCIIFDFKICKLNYSVTEIEFEFNKIQFSQSKKKN